jgi:hypothetical protein
MHINIIRRYIYLSSRLTSDVDVITVDEKALEASFGFGNRCTPEILQ